jgi:acylphosphatase
MNKRVHIWISGWVQGVGFRASARRKANELGIVGHVRNLPDRRVEIVAEGASEPLAELLAWCRKGPPGAKIQSVQITEEFASNEFTSFRIRH